jgi:tetratricopeptide (TPR) repeat protein
MTRLAAIALLLLVPGARGAPVPKPRPGLTEEQRELLKSAEADFEEAYRIGARPVPPGADARAEQAARGAARRAAFRSAGLKLSRLHARAGRADRASLDTVASQAGRAWILAGEHATALPYYEDIASRSRCADTRAGALGGVAVCLTALGRKEEAERALQRAYRERERKGGAVPTLRDLRRARRAAR